MNAERKMHYHARSDLVREWREAFCVLALEENVPRLDRVAIEVYVTSGTRKLADTGAVFGAQKAAVDGLRDAGVLEDDTGDYVKWITFFPVDYVKGIDSMTIKIIDLS